MSSVLGKYPEVMYYLCEFNPNLPEPTCSDEDAATDYGRSYSGQLHILFGQAHSLLNEEPFPFVEIADSIVREFVNDAQVRQWFITQ